MADQLRETIRNYKFVWEERTFRLGCSVGVVPITGDSEDVAALLSAADSACAAAKEAGRNRVYSFQENDIDLMRRRREMQWAARINNALEESRFELYRMTIQPLQKAEPGAHYELLLRMRDEAGQDRLARQLHRRGRALRHHARDRPLGGRERAALAGVRGGRARAARAVLDQPLRPEPWRRQVPAVRDRPVPAAAASTPPRSASRSPRRRPSPASRRPTASSTR